MATRNSTRSSTSRSSADAHGGVDPQAAGESVRQQLGLITQGAESMLRTAEAWQQAQLQFTQRTRSSYREAAARMGHVTNPAELLSIQSGLMMSAFQQAMQFSMDLMTASLAQQSEAGAAAQPATVMGTTAAANPGFAAMAPMVQAWQSMFTPSTNSAGSSTAH